MEAKKPVQTFEEFSHAWAAEYSEWSNIRDEMIAAARSPTAFDVTIEQRKRMLARGEISVLDGAFARRFINRSIDARGRGPNVQIGNHNVQNIRPPRRP